MQFHLSVPICFYQKKLSNKTNTTVVYTVYFIQLWFLQLMRIQQTRQERRGKENNINMNN